MLVQIDVIEFHKGPNRTALELSRAIHGNEGYQQLVHQDCERLVNSGRVERRGTGVPGDPFRYFPETTLRLVA
jgi:hypothetical protein